MAASARLEIHVINVGQGDSILIVNRKLDVLRENLEAAYEGHGDLLHIYAAEDIDLMPWAMKAQRDTITGAEAVMRGTVEAALLIDGGEDSYGSDVVAYLESQGVLIPGQAYCPNLSLLVTHYHSDHIAGLLYLFTEVREVRVPVSQTLLTPTGRLARQRKVKTIQQKLPRYRPGRIYFTRPDPTTDPGTLVLKDLRKSMQNAATIQHGDEPGQSSELCEILPGGRVSRWNWSTFSNEVRPAIIPLGRGTDQIPIQFRMIASSCAAWHPVLQTNLPAENGKLSKDPNDHSIVGVLEYGSFRAFFGGDIAGNGTAAGGNATYVQPATGKKRFSQHGDVEKVVVPALRATYPVSQYAIAGEPKTVSVGNCMVYKASHHASNSSNDIHTMSTLRPRVAAISSGIKESYHKHPTPEVLNRMTAPATWSYVAGGTVDNSVQQGVYVTEMAATYNNAAVAPPPPAVKLVGDIIIRPIDQSVAAIQAARTFGNQLEVQVFGTGIQSSLDNTKSSFRPCTSPITPGPYPIAAVIHRCDLH